MPKVCVACGLLVENPQKSPEESEDCPNCGEPDGCVEEKTEEKNNEIPEEEEE